MILAITLWNISKHRWASLIQKQVPLIVGPLLYGLVSLTAGPLT